MTDFDFRAGTHIDGYTLIRVIGRGGFGEVWLAQSDVLNAYFAVKVVRNAAERAGMREMEALRKFKGLGGIQGVISIEHVGMVEGALYYVMPLADGTTDSNPRETEWSPLTLRHVIESRKAEPNWISLEDVRSWFTAIATAAAAINDLGLVHRDIKPDNILFFNGAPVLSDISLMAEDGTSLSNVGTPGFLAPSWYIESGGNPDMYGIATSLFSALTGNHPDKLGRAAFIWPPQGRGLLSVEQQKEYQRLHRVIFRATHDRSQERFLSLSAMAEMIADQPKPVASSIYTRFPVPTLIAASALCLTALIALASILPSIFKPEDDLASPTQPTATVPADSDEDDLTPDQIADYKALLTMVALYYADKQYQNALESVNLLFETYPVSRKNPGLSTYRAISLYHLNRHDEALAELKSLNDPSTLDMLNTIRRINLWGDLGDLKGAEDELTMIIDNRPVVSMHFLLRARVRLDRGDFPGVEADIHRMARSDPTFDVDSVEMNVRKDFADQNEEYAAWLTAQSTAPN